MQLNNVSSRKPKIALLAPVLFAALLAGCSSEPENPADAVYFGGDILTMAGEQPQYAEALAIDDGKFSFIGSKAEADKLVGKATRQVDLAGATLIPAIVTGVKQDLTLQGVSNTPNCWKDANFKTKDDLIAALKAAKAERVAVVPGLFCMGYDPTVVTLTEADLDAAFPDTSVILVESSLQRVLSSTVAKQKYSRDAYKTLKSGMKRGATEGVGLQVGQSADFMIIDKNKLKDDTTAFASIQIKETWVQGKPVADAPKDLAMLAILDLFAAYAEETAAKAKLDEMNAVKAAEAADAKRAADSAAAAKKAADAKEAKKKSAEPKPAPIKKPVASKPAAASKPVPVEAPAAAATDPAKPKEARFNMTQDGKKMTPEDFDAWMKAQGIRIVPAKPATPPPPPEEKKG
jgi:hypothetical protein